jgi:hypothetical protein
MPFPPHFAQEDGTAAAAGSATVEVVATRRRTRHEAVAAAAAALATCVIAPREFLPPLYGNCPLGVADSREGSTRLSRPRTLLTPTRPQYHLSTHSAVTGNP